MRLHINIDHVATVRQARRTDEPDPVRAAVLAELGGADGITVHLREDRRHIQDRDVRLLMETVRTGVNLELAAIPSMVAIARELQPMAATLVPERREEITTEGGLAFDDAAGRDRVETAVRDLVDAGIRTSLFIGPDANSVAVSEGVGAQAVELHTGSFAHCFRGAHVTAAETLNTEVARIRRAAAQAASLGLAVHAGHGLTYENVAAVARIDEIEELNIDHSVISRAMLVGMDRAVREMRAVIARARGTGRTP
jgi:pyridoxine 5-phosphate synthase